MILKRKYLIKKKNAYIINTNTLMISNKQMTIYVLCINLIYFPYCRNYAGIVVNKKKKHDAYSIQKKYIHSIHRNDIKYIILY